MERRNKSLGYWQTERYRWTEDAGSQLRNWFIREKIPLKDAFKQIDSDGDGFISLKDLTTFYTKIIRFQPQLVTSTNIKNLMVQMDKDQDRITLASLGRFLNGNHYNYDWIVNAKNQIGAAISRNFDSIEKAFDTIGKNQMKMPISLLRQWIIDNVFKDGQLATEVMSIIGKNGYLLLQDFKREFNYHIWHTPLAICLTNALQERFLTAKMAYQYLSERRYLDYWKFVRFVYEIVGDRFGPQYYKQLWDYLAAGDKVIDQNRFLRTIGQGLSGEWIHIPPEKKGKFIKYQEESELVSRLAQNYRILEERLKQYSTNGLVEQAIVERVFRYLIYELKMNFYPQLYSKVIIEVPASVVGNKIHISRLMAGLISRATDSKQFLHNRLKHCW